MFGRYGKLLDAVSDLALAVARLEKRVSELELVDGLDRAEAKPDPVQERMNRMFAEGLDNLMSYDGRPQEASADGDE